MRDMSQEDKEQLSLELKAEPKANPETKDTRPEGQILEWVSHPAKRKPLVTVMVSLFIAVLVIIVYYMTYSVWFSVLGFVILYGSLSAFYFPTRYRLTDDGIEVKTTFQRLQKKWSQYRTCYPDKNGILLSPFARPSRLENFRGLYLRFWYNRDEVVAFVRAQIEKARAAEKGAS
jgi:hypothetical protein